MRAAVDSLPRRARRPGGGDAPVPGRRRNASPRRPARSRPSLSAAHRGDELHHPARRRPVARFDRRGRGDPGRCQPHLQDADLRVSGDPRRALRQRAARAGHPGAGSAAQGIASARGRIVGLGRTADPGAPQPVVDDGRGPRHRLCRARGRACRDHPDAPSLRAARLARDRRLAPLDRGDRGRHPQPDDRASGAAGVTRLILASASASRAQILTSAGVVFDVVPANVDEDTVKASVEEPRAVAEALASLKAFTVSASHPGHLVLGADQVLVLEGRIMSKAPDLATAAEHLRRLRGRRHVLISALALARGGAPVWRHASVAALTMRDFSDAFLDDYLAREGEEVLGSVGCYRLEGLGAQLFETVEGDYFSILGLPLQPLLGALRGFGVILA
ncbi:MAG: septum formation protein Maf [Alphaproteobacteria bacterium]|nr:septum formation protein Maf [Alphaproteobacteria bacterium]